MSADIQEASLDACRSWRPWFRVMVAKRQKRERIAAERERMRAAVAAQLARSPNFTQAGAIMESPKEQRVRVTRWFA